MQFFRRCPPKCANHIHSQWDHTELMNTNRILLFIFHWLAQENDMNFLFRKAHSIISEILNFQVSEFSIKVEVQCPTAPYENILYFSF